MSIVDKIKSNIAALSGLPCYYGSMEELNVIMCNATFPCFYFAQLTDMEIEENNGNYTERVRVALVACDKTGFDPDSTENEQIIDECKGRIFDVIRVIGAEGDVEMRSFNSARRVYQEFDVIVTGYAVNIDFAELYGDTGCDIEPITMAITANGVYDVRGVRQVDVDVPILQKPRPTLVYFKQSSVVENIDTGDEHGNYPQNAVLCYDTDELDSVIHFRSLDYSAVTMLAFSCLNRYRWHRKMERPCELDFTGLGIKLTSLYEAVFNIGVYPSYAPSDCLYSFSIDIHDWDLSRVKNINNLFVLDANTKFKINMRGVSARSCESDPVTIRCPGAITMIGGATLEEVINEHITIYTDIACTITIMNGTIWDEASVLALMYGLRDLVADGIDTRQLRLSSGKYSAKNFFTKYEQIAIDKGWTVVYL